MKSIITIIVALAYAICGHSYAYAVDWIPIPGTSGLLYDKDSIKDGDYGPNVWIKKNGTFPGFGRSETTDKIYPPGTPYEQLELNKLFCKAGYTQVIATRVVVNGVVDHSDQEPKEQVPAAPGGSGESLLKELCKKAWEFWK